MLGTGVLAQTYLGGVPFTGTPTPPISPSGRPGYLVATDPGHIKPPTYTRSP